MTGSKHLTQLSAGWMFFMTGAGEENAAWSGLGGTDGSWSAKPTWDSVWHEFHTTMRLDLGGLNYRICLLHLPNTLKLYIIKNCTAVSILSIDLSILPILSMNIYIYTNKHIFTSRHHPVVELLCIYVQIRLETFWPSCSLDRTRFWRVNIK